MRMKERNKKIRINKYLAKQGIATRIGADALIEAGAVFVNGKKTELGRKVGPEDKVEVHQSGAKKTYRYLAYCKPAGVVTVSPEAGEKAIADIFPLEGLFPVGRLDKNSEGLIILTNDGRVTDRLLNPKYEHEKEYLAETEKTVGESFKRKMEVGVNIGEGEKTKPCEVKVVDENHFIITLTEGKRHQIKRMAERLGMSIRSLKRVRIMNIKLGGLAPNQARAIKDKELEEFLKVLGLFLFIAARF